uniref:Uncharacterized protein n=1 Tax=Amphimedon queenslandica TaxID=400682 RepID=A0A1X7U1L8_AMPQE
FLTLLFHQLLVLLLILAFQILLVMLLKAKVILLNNQTGIKFSSCLFGSFKQIFQASWYANCKRLEYLIEREAAFCFPCRFFGVSPNPVLVST